MRAHLMSRRSPSDPLVDDLLEVLEDLLAVPELLCFERDDLFEETHEAILRADVVCRAVRDELAEPEGAR